MSVKTLLAAARRSALAVLVLASSSPAQTVPPQPGKQPPASFAVLLRVVDVGEPVTVTDQAGNKVRGNVLRTSESSLEILEEQRWFRRRVIAFTEPEVVTVAHHDSNWQGTVLGLAAGVAFGLIESCQSGDDCISKAYSALIFVPFVTTSIGSVLDDSIERTLYDSGRASALAQAGRLFVLPRVGVGTAYLGRGIETMPGGGGSVGYWLTPRQGVEVETWLLPTHREDYGRVLWSLLNFNLLLRLRANETSPFLVAGVGFVFSHENSVYEWGTIDHSGVWPTFTVGGGLSIPVSKYISVVPEVRVSLVDRLEFYPRSTIGVAYRFK